MWYNYSIENANARGVRSTSARSDQLKGLFQMATADITTKRCTKCKRVLPKTTEYFYKASDGYFRSNCKECTLQTNYSYAKSPHGREIMSEAGKRYANTQNGKEKLRLKASNYRSNNPEKERARKTVSAAVRSHKLPQVSTCKCEMCGKQAQTYHHWSYEPEHWLHVIPLCIKCHKKVHNP